MKNIFNSVVTTLILYFISLYITDKLDYSLIISNSGKPLLCVGDTK